MKKYLLLNIIFLVGSIIFAAPASKPVQPAPASQAALNAKNAFYNAMTPAEKIAYQKITPAEKLEFKAMTSSEKIAYLKMTPSEKASYDKMTPKEKVLSSSSVKAAQKTAQKKSAAQKGGFEIMKKHLEKYSKKELEKKLPKKEKPKKHIEYFYDPVTHKILGSVVIQPKQPEHKKHEHKKPHLSGKPVSGKLAPKQQSAPQKKPTAAGTQQPVTQPSH